METGNRICFMNCNPVWGGGEKWHFDSAVGLNNLGAEVVVICHPKGELYKRLRDSGIKVVPFTAKKLSFLNPAKVRKLVGIIRKEKVKSIVFGIPQDLKIGAIAAKRAGVEKIVYARALAAPVKARKRNFKLFNHYVTHVVVNSEETKKQMLSDDGSLVPADKFHLIYYGMNLDEWQTRGAELIYERKADEIVIGNVGRLVEQKGQIYLIEAIGKLSDKGIDVKLIIAGTGELESNLKARANELGVSDNIEFVGFIRNVKSVTESIDIFVLSSLWEGFGYVLAEAMMSSKPVVAFDISSNPEVVENNITGYLVKPKDVDAMVSKIEELAKNPELRTKLGTAGLERVRQHFLLDDANQKLYDLLK